MTSKRRLSYNARYSYEPIALLRQNATHHSRFYSKTTKNGEQSPRIRIDKTQKGDERASWRRVVIFAWKSRLGLCSSGKVKRLSIGNWKKTKEDENVMFLGDNLIYLFIYLFIYFRIGQLDI